jgi:hypothetical protein
MEFIVSMCGKFKLFNNISLYRVEVRDFKNSVSLTKTAKIVVYKNYSITFYHF